MKSRLFFPVLAVLFIPILFILLMAHSVAGATQVSGVIRQNTTWSGEIHVIGDVVVNQNVTLTISPGTTVRFDADGNVFDLWQYLFPGKPKDEDWGTSVWLCVMGRLVAEGTPEKLITFTSDATNPRKGDWACILFHKITGDSSLKYCVVEYGEDAINTSGDGDTSHTITIHNNLIRYSEEGILLSSVGKADIQYNTIYDTYEGIEYHKSMEGYCKPVTLKNNIIVYNRDIGINNSSRGCSYVTSYNNVWSNRLNYDQGYGDRVESSIIHTKDISVDPKFVDYPGDIQLQIGSPCKTASDERGEIGFYGNRPVTPGSQKLTLLPILSLLFNKELLKTQDCNGDQGGTAYLDNCNICVGGNTGKTPCSSVETVTSAGQIWMDRNLGASRVATSSTDSQAYGDLYQWGRGTDGHEKRTSPTTSTKSTTDVPGHGRFITDSSSTNDWRTPQNDNLWQGVSGTNNPCPSGYRLPTYTEIETERASWSSNNSVGAFASPLNLVLAGFREKSNGTVSTSSSAYYWSSTVNGSGASSLYFSSSTARSYDDYRGYGNSVRCLKD